MDSASLAPTARSRQSSANSRRPWNWFSATRSTSPRKGYIRVSGIACSVWRLFRILSSTRAQAMRLSTYDKPRIIACAEDHPHHIGLPRGCLDEVRQTLPRPRHSSGLFATSATPVDRWT